MSGGGNNLTAKAGTGTVTVVAPVSGVNNLALSGGTLALNGGTITTTGSQSYTGATVLGAATMLTTTNAAVTFAGTLDGAQTLGVAAGTGTVTLGQAVGATTKLASLTLTGGTLALNGGQVSTTGAQSYNGAIALGADTTLNSSAGNLNFGGTIDGARSLTANAPAGTVAIGGAVGGTTPLTTLNLTATGANISAAVHAATIDIVDSGPAGSSLVLGDGTNATGSGNFSLSNAAIGQLQATNTLSLDASQANKPAVIIGNMAIAAPVQNFNIYGLGSIVVQGNLLSGGTGSSLKNVQIGGDATNASDLASQFAIIATTDGATGTLQGTGGAINVGAAALNLSAASIGVGLQTGFLDRLGLTGGGTPSGTTALSMINNPGSSLYDANFGGAGSYSAPNLVVAGSMTVRYTNFALFQNTALPGQNTGVALASAATPATPALSLLGIGAAQAGPVALFGTINGVSGVPTALLGGTIVRQQNVSPGTARVNGCVIGSSAGCITPAPLSTVLQAVDPVHLTVFYANTDYVITFDPLVGTNNEALFDSFDVLGIGEIPAVTPKCTPGQAGCPQPSKGAH